MFLSTRKAISIQWITWVQTSWCPFDEMQVLSFINLYDDMQLRNQWAYQPLPAEWFASAHRRPHDQGLFGIRADLKICVANRSWPCQHGFPVCVILMVVWRWEKPMKRWMRFDLQPNCYLKNKPRYLMGVGAPDAWLMRGFAVGWICLTVSCRLELLNGTCMTSQGRLPENASVCWGLFTPLILSASPHVRITHRAYLSLAQGW